MLAKNKASTSRTDGRKRRFTKEHRKINNFKYGIFYQNYLFLNNNYQFYKMIMRLKIYVQQPDEINLQLKSVQI